MSRAPLRNSFHLLLLLPFLGLLSVPLYNRADPEILGFPFFYWFQFAWVPVTSLLTYFVYRRDKKIEAASHVNGDRHV
ncbi:MAG: DUF3311 domain-containing protein [Cryobacterium sp.]|nr:DUF3311 domain-containing protein [Oligoflexia bacterium]